MGRERHKLRPEEEKRVVGAIRAAEKGCRGEVRVHVEAVCEGDALARAREVFTRLGMGKTRGGTAVLLYVASASHKASVFAGPGIYGGASPEIWKEVADAVAEGGRAGDLALGLENALAKVGALLRERAPGEDHAGDELPNAISTEGEADIPEPAPGAGA